MQIYFFGGYHGDKSTRKTPKKETVIFWGGVYLVNEPNATSYQQDVLVNDAKVVATEKMKLDSMRCGALGLMSAKGLSLRSSKCSTVQLQGSSLRSFDGPAPRLL